VLPVIFPELLTSGQLYYSDVMILYIIKITVGLSNPNKKKINSSFSKEL
jgi:hypothetical protein